MIKKCREDRDTQIQLHKTREEKKATDIVEAEEKFKDEHKEEIETALKAEQDEQEKANDEYGEEEEEEEGEKEKKPKEKPVMPEFNHEEFLQKWEEDNPIVIIPDEIMDEFDRDWVLTEEEEEELIKQYFLAKEEGK